MKAVPSANRGHKTTNLKPQYNGIPVAKVKCLADRRYFRPLKKHEVKAAREYLEHRLGNAGLSDRRGEASRPIISVEERVQSEVWRIDPVTGQRTLIVPRKIVKKEKRLRTVTSHAQAIAALTGDDGEDIHEHEYSEREIAWSRNRDGDDK